MSPSSSWFESMTTSTLNGSPCWTCAGTLTAETWTSGSVRVGSGTVETLHPGVERGLARRRRRSGCRRSGRRSWGRRTAGSPPRPPRWPRPGSSRCRRSADRPAVGVVRCRPGSTPGSAAKSRYATRFGPALGSGLGDVRPRPPCASRRRRSGSGRSRRRRTARVVGRSSVRPARASTSRTTIRRPAGQRQRLLPAGEVDQAADEVVDERCGRTDQADEPGGAGQLERESRSTRACSADPPR